ncbi:MAG: hypothetical protein ACKO96_27460, partial [Flammeovirgaceae bacterium]
TTQFDPTTGNKAPNVLLAPPLPPAPITPRRLRGVLDEIACSLAPLLQAPERTTAQHFQIGAPSPTLQDRGSSSQPSLGILDEEEKVCCDTQRL